MKGDIYTLQDPTKQYPQPKFRHQSQRVPGLDKKMRPKPDHGETSYRGSSRLPNRKALVTGGDSGIGRAAAIAFAREGADVAITYLPSEEADAREVIALIEQAGRKAFRLPGDLTKESFARKAVKDAEKKLGGLDILAFPQIYRPNLSVPSFSYTQDYPYNQNQTVVRLSEDTDNPAVHIH